MVRSSFSILFFIRKSKANPKRFLRNLLSLYYNCRGDIKQKQICINQTNVFTMYTVIKRMEISASHSLKLSYPSKCEKLHGHNWIITVYCRSKELDENGMVVDFTHIKQAVEKQLDHNNLNDILPFNPTAENIACWICNQVPHCFKVEVKESEGNTAIYEKD